MKTKQIIILKWDSLVLSITSILYGITLHMNEGILINYKVYALIQKIFDNHAISLVFITLGVTKLISIFLNNNKLKRISLIGLSAIWMVFCVSFVLSPPVNTVWIFSLSMALLAFGIALKEG